jgi:hypothetical protein
MSHPIKSLESHFRVKLREALLFIRIADLRGPTTKAQLANQLANLAKFLPI